MLLIYAIICLPFAFIYRRRYYSYSWLLNWIICVAVTPVLGIPLNKLFWNL